MRACSAVTLRRSLHWILKRGGMDYISCLIHDFKKNTSKLFVAQPGYTGSVKIRLLSADLVEAILDVLITNSQVLRANTLSFLLWTVHTRPPRCWNSIICLG